MHYADVASLVGQVTTAIGASSFITVACPIVSQSVLGLTLLVPSGAIACGIIAIGSASIAAWGNPDYRMHFALGSAAILTGAAVAVAGLTGVIAVAGLSVFAGVEARRRHQLHQERIAKLNGKYNQAGGIHHGH